MFNSDIDTDINMSPENIINMDMNINNNIIDLSIYNSPDQWCKYIKHQINYNKENNDKIYDLLNYFKSSLRSEIFTATLTIAINSLLLLLCFYCFCVVLSSSLLFFIYNTLILYIPCVRLSSDAFELFAVR